MTKTLPQLSPLSLPRHPGRPNTSPTWVLALNRVLALSLAVGLAVGCAPSGPSPAERASFAQQYLTDAVPDGAISVAELWKQLSPGDNAPTSSAPADGQPAATEPSSAAQPVVAQPAATAVDSEGRLKLVLKARLAGPSPDLAAAIPLYPWDDRGTAFYVTELGDHAHAGHDDNCPFCQARKAKAGGMGQLVKVVLVGPDGQPQAKDLRPLLQWTGTETLYLAGTARRLPSGLVELQAQQLHVDRAATQ